MTVDAAEPFETRRDLDVAEYALGSLPADARAAFEARLALEPELQAQLDAWRLRLAPLAAGTAPETPSTELWSRIAATVETMAPFPTIRAEEGDWLPLVPGVARKVLHVDEARGFHSFLLRFEPGSVLPAHDHAEDEECMMISGEVVIAGLRLAAGDYQLAPKGRRHPAISSPTGGLVYIRAAIRRRPPA